jgi:putative nucleotidyltransferase with HDIG domain
MSVLKRVLFVDDEPRVLEGLQRMLHEMRHEWDMDFVASGDEALAVIAQQPFDVVVSDMRMPVMDGAELLDEVRRRCPSAVRVILSGHSGQELILKSLGPTHQFLAKPCDAEDLKAAVARACALRDLLDDERLKAVVSNVKTLPSVPALYDRLLAMLRSPDCALQEVADVIGSDVAMTAKILQVVNSAFFGLRRRADNLSQAILSLGLETVRSIVLSAGVFAEIEGPPQAAEAAQALYSHSVAVGTVSEQITRRSCPKRERTDDVLTAGMLHDVGKLVLAAQLPEAYDEVCRRTREEGVPAHEAEQEVLGITHAELGAYLLGLWGLPEPIVEAVAFHHRPPRGLHRASEVLTAVHVTNGLVHEAAQEEGGDHASRIDMEYLQEVGLADQLPRWRELCTSALSNQEHNASTRA